MALAQSTGFCLQCNRQTLVARQAPAHLLHFVLTVCTCSLWSVVWALAAFGPRRWRCQVCGGKRLSGFKQVSAAEWVILGAIGLVLAAGAVLALAAIVDQFAPVPTAPTASPARPSPARR